MYMYIIVYIFIFVYLSMHFLLYYYFTYYTAATSSYLPLKQPITYIALKHCNATVWRWNRYAVCKGLSTANVKQRPSYFKKKFVLFGTDGTQ